MKKHKQLEKIRKALGLCPETDKKKVFQAAGNKKKLAPLRDDKLEGADSLNQALAELLEILESIEHTQGKFTLQ